MKTKIFKLGVLVSLLTVSGSAYALEADVSGSADTSVNINRVIKTDVKADAQVKLETRLEKGKSHANQEIDRRISALNALNTRINGLVRVSASEKARISSSIQSQVSALTSLKTKVSADADIDALKTDIKSITASYRIFMLVIPQGRIAATVDVINTTSDLITNVGVKLQTRITAAANAGKDVTEMNSLLADMKAKSADAKVQAAAALALTSNLKADNGDEAIIKANNEAFASARAKIKLAHTDLQNARQDARKIVNILKSMKISVTASSTTTVQ